MAYAATKTEQSAGLGIWELRDAINVNELIDSELSDELGRDVVAGYESDEESRAEWTKRMDNAIKLALQMVEEKSYPWRGASNVKFPLVTIGALQFSARSYPTLVKVPDVVKYRVTGDDNEGKKAARAGRVGRHMSYQLLEEDEDWEEEFDKALLALPILGTVFKKSFFDPIKGRNVSRLTLPQNLCVNYYARSIEDCERKTEIFQLYDREIKERQLKGLYSEVDLGVAPLFDSQSLSDKRQGLMPPPDDRTRPRDILEQHKYCDLDGDGYPEPYVIVVDKATKKVLRIVARFAEVETAQSVKIGRLTDQAKFIDIQVLELAQTVQPPTGEEDEQQVAHAQQVMAQVEAMRQRQREIQQQIETLRASNEKNPQVLSIVPEEHYTKYTFIPSPDGGFYDLGLGALLGPINDAVNTSINQLIDVGHLQAGSQGFIGKGARIKGGQVSFEPFEWKRVSVAGQTLRDSIVPLPVNQPSAVLFNLLSLLIQYGERISSVNDAMTGQNPGQNTPAYNYQAMLEQGLQVFNGVFKRVYRSFRKELKKLYVLNRTYLNPIEYFETLDGPAQVLQNDYLGDEKDIYPAADPNAFSNMERLMKAHFLAERAALVPGYNMPVVERKLLEAMDIEDVQQIYPLDEKGNPAIQPPPNPEIEVKVAEEQRRTIESQSRMSIQAAEAESRMDVDQSTVILNEARAMQLGDQSAIDKFKALTDRLETRAKARNDKLKLAVEAMKRESDKTSEG